MTDIKIYTIQYDTQNNSSTETLIYFELHCTETIIFDTNTT